MHWYIDPLTKHYVDFEGRIGRQAFWMFVLINFVVSMIASTANEVVGAMYSLAVFLPSLAITARRLHDTDKSGWWQLLWLVPIIGWIIIVVFCATKGDSQPNRYGAPAPTGDSAGSGAPAPTSQTVHQSDVPPSPQA